MRRMPTKSQEFTATQSAKASDMSIAFTESATYTLEYYEDGSTTSTRTFVM
ncbi:MAG TPA: hypothetical protein VK152_03330 [Paludibacter sp.]|nr:hypothetical protein [Paludibacter sp.]